jgi:hypothetical protein
MTTFLLILKIFGIIVSGASVIGSQRLKNFENKIRELIKWDIINSYFDKIRISLLPSFLKSIARILKNVFNKVWNFLRGLGLAENPDSSNTDLEIQGKRKQPLIRDVVSKVSTFAYLIFVIPFALILYILFLAMYLLLVAIFFFLVLIIATILFLTEWTTRILSELLKFSVWIVSRPYAWLDLEISKRGMESTIVVIGILVAVIAEIFTIR